MLEAIYQRFQISRDYIGTGDTMPFALYGKQAGHRNGP